MKKNIISLILGVTIIGGLGFNIIPVHATTNGWALNAESKWSYYSNGQRTTGWIKPDGYNWYYLNTNGEMLTGFQYINGQWYYLEDNDNRYKGAMTFDNKIGPYMFNMDGSMSYKDKNALYPDEAYLKLTQYLLGKGYDPAEYSFDYTPYNKATNKFGVIVCGYIDEARTILGKPVIEMYINVTTGQLSRY